MEGRALSQAGHNDPPRCPQAHDYGPPHKPQNQVGQATTLPSLLSNNRGFHIDCFEKAVTSRPNHSIKAYWSGVCRAGGTVPGQLPGVPSKARQAGWEHGGTSATARIKVHRDCRFECQQKKRRTSRIKVRRRHDTGRCKAPTPTKLTQVGSSTVPVKHTTVRYS